MNHRSFGNNGYSGRSDPNSITQRRNTSQRLYGKTTNAKRGEARLRNEHRDTRESYQIHQQRTDPRQAQSKTARSERDKLRRHFSHEHRGGDGKNSRDHGTKASDTKEAKQIKINSAMCSTTARGKG